jgi:DNA-binding NarL/FixJ family response regulator
MIRVLIADEHRSFAEALAIRLDAEPGLAIVATVTRPAEALRATRGRPPDVAIVDVDGGDDFLALAEPLRAMCPGVGLVAVSGGEDIEVLARAVRHGFRGWVSKEAAVETLVDVLKALRVGETCIPPLLLTGLLAHLLQEEVGRSAAATAIDSLTARELQVLRAMSSGASRQDVAAQLGISANTLRTHVQNVLTKLGVHTSLAAVQLARSAGVT